MNRYILLLPVLFLMLTGCEKKYKVDVYVNHEAEICGVKDPANNIDWLKSELDYLKNSACHDQSMYDCTIYADSVGELSIVFVGITPPYWLTYAMACKCDGSKFMVGYWWSPWYDFDAIPPTTPRNSDTYCSPNSNDVFMSTSADYRPEVDTFFNTHTFVDFIARIRAHAK
ncbi:MAG: hypothetical protein ACI3Z7_02045 [Candidatus Aphodosoma sp.]